MNPDNPWDALIAKLARSVSVTAGAVLSRLDTLHVRKSHETPIDKNGRVMQGLGKLGDRPLFREAPSVSK